MYAKSSLLAVCGLLAALQSAEGFQVGNGITRSSFHGRAPVVGSLQPKQRSVDALFNSDKRSQQYRRNGMAMRAVAPRAFSSGDWFENLQNLPKSKLLESIQSHLIANTVWAVAVSIIHGLSPYDDVHISTVPHAIMASALGLLLVFRNNAAYDRFWEARKIWGSVTNTVRNVARLSYASMGDDEYHHRQMMEYLKSFPWLLKQHLQDERNDEEMKWLNVSPEEFEAIQSCPNPPLLACERMSQVVRSAFGGGTLEEAMNSLEYVNGDAPASNSQKSAWYRFQLETEINLLIDCLGMCERVLGTPVPRSYSRHTSRLLTVYLATVPIVLVPHLDYWTGPVVGAMAWGLLSIEAIAYYIEQPFDKVKQQLPLITYCQKMRVDLERMTTTSPLPPSYIDTSLAPTAIREARDATPLEELLSGSWSAPASLRQAAAPVPAMAAAAPAPVAATPEPEVEAAVEVASPEPVTTMEASTDEPEVEAAEEAQSHSAPESVPEPAREPIMAGSSKPARVNGVSAKSINPFL